VKLVLEPSDYQEVRDVIAGHIEGEPTDAQIDAAFVARPTILGKALSWGWNDTEVRDELCELLDGMDKQ
jgi:hypothetical protein